MSARSRAFLIGAISVALFGCGTSIFLIARAGSTKTTEAPASVAQTTTQRTGPRTRNLALQPEAFRMSRRLGNRFSGSRLDSSVITGTLTVGGNQQSVSIVRQQTNFGETLDIGLGATTFTWSDLDGARVSGSQASEAQRLLIERLVFDSADKFVLAQLRGASYYTVARNVRPDEVDDSYNGPVWTMVRVTDPHRDEQRKPESSWRLYYINATTGLIDKIVSENGGERTEANLNEWSTREGETLPSRIVWTRNGQTIMEFKLNSFVLSDAR